MLKLNIFLATMLVFATHLLAVPIPSEDSSGGDDTGEVDGLYLCERSVLLNTTSCMDASQDKFIYCIDETDSKCECPQDTFCHYVGMAKCNFVCVETRDHSGEIGMPHDGDYNEFSIKGPNLG